MATSAEVVRSELALVTTAALAEIRAAAPDLSPDPIEGALGAISLLVPSYYDATGALAVAWYDERRSEATPSTLYTPQIVGDPTTDWIDREVEQALRDMDVDAEAARILDEAYALAEKEIARGFRDSMLGNLRQDVDAIGWSRVARAGACKFCVMLAGKGSVYRSESTAIFAAHKNCHCAARPEFRGGEYGPEANVVQYLASSRRAKEESVQAARNKRVRAYLNKNYPDAPG